MNNIVWHIHEVTYASYDVHNMFAYFKMDKNGKIWFLYASNGLYARILKDERAYNLYLKVDKPTKI
jgi:hypothetical protein